MQVANGRFLVLLWCVVHEGQEKRERKELLGISCQHARLKRVFTDLRCSRPILFFVLQIAPSAKKLWGVDEGGSKDEGGVKGGGTLLHLGDHQTTMWRDSTWSTSGTIRAITRLCILLTEVECVQRKPSMVEKNRNRLVERKAYKGADPKHANSTVTFKYCICTTLHNPYYTKLHILLNC